LPHRRSRTVAVEKRRGGSGKKGRQGTFSDKTFSDDGRDYLIGLRSWGLRPQDLVMLTGADSYVDAWRSEPDDAE